MTEFCERLSKQFINRLEADDHNWLVVKKEQQDDLSTVGSSLLMGGSLLLSDKFKRFQHVIKDSVYDLALSLNQNSIDEADKLKELPYFKVASPCPENQSPKLCTCCGNLALYFCAACSVPYCSVVCSDLHLKYRCR
ncbi:hypothetical protein RF11_08715 [Thelohanellus kitauei]|uniref:Zinc finger HIT domain-containing protein 1 n=1 Tax=Thelohanellus kitauei TaxID=669202 RepID=A0A0C2MVG9_THEKT|nr:hypothetical protein RF11_08715 [Thelohanellus kitauei]